MLSDFHDLQMVDGLEMASRLGFSYWKWGLK